LPLCPPCYWIWTGCFERTLGSLAEGWS
jgi:hypothetical protein